MNVRIGTIGFLLETSKKKDGEVGFDPKTLEWYYFLNGDYDSGVSKSVEEIFKIFKRAL